MPFLPVAVAGGFAARGLAALATLPAERLLARDAAAQTTANLSVTPDTAAPASTRSLGTGPALTDSFAASGQQPAAEEKAAPRQPGPKGP